MRRRSLDSVRSEAFRQPTPRPVGANLRATTGSPARLIAEIKRRSPSAGAMADVPDPVVLARTYQANGASAISTLTDGHFFGGSLDDLRAVSQAVTIPVLRKDFLFTEYQLWEARAAGADAAVIGATTFGAGLPSGDITRVALDACVRFDGTIFVAEITGAELAAILQKSNQDPATPLAARRGENLVAVGPTTPLDPARRYRLATTDWAAKNARTYFGSETLGFVEQPTLRLKALVTAALIPAP